MTTKFPPSLSGISHTHTHTRSVMQFCSVNKILYICIFSISDRPQRLNEHKDCVVSCMFVFVRCCAWYDSRPTGKFVVLLKSGLHGVRSPVRNLAMQFFFWMHSVWEWEVMKWQSVVNNCNSENLLVPLFLSICWAQFYCSWWVLLEVESHKQMINSPKNQRKK